MSFRTADRAQADPDEPPGEVGRAAVADQPDASTDPTERHAAELLPYRPRPGQAALAARAHATFAERGQAVIEAGTGTGKTVAVLAAALDVARTQARRVLFLTRTNSQARQAVIEFEALRRHDATPDAQDDRPAPSTTSGQGAPEVPHPAQAFSIALQGRAHLCPELRADPRYAGASAEEFARVCGRLKKASLERHGYKSLEEAWPGWRGADPIELEAGGFPTGDSQGTDGHFGADADSEASQLSEGDADDAVPLSRRDRRTQHRTGHGSKRRGCPFYDALIEAGPEKVRRIARGGSAATRGPTATAVEAASRAHPKPADTTDTAGPADAADTASPADTEDPATRFSAAVEGSGMCPYEAAKAMLPDAALVIAPYVYAADPNLRAALQEWMRTPLHDWLLVADEAHNVPDYLRDLHSPELSRETIKRCANEAAAFGDPQVLPGWPATRVATIMGSILDDAVAEHVPEDEEDAPVPPDFVTVRLLSDLKTTSRGLQGAMHALHAVAEKVRADEERKGRLPRSYLGSLAAFLEHWLSWDPETHAPIVTKGENPKLLLHCVDASVGSEFFSDAAAAIHMSGTLQPMEQYRDVMGLPASTTLQTFPSPYAASQLRIVLVDDVTTRYETRTREPEMMDRMHEHIQRFLAVTGVNSCVLFPSHGLLANALELGIRDTSDRPVYVEGRDLDQIGLMRMLKRFRDDGVATQSGGPGAALLAISGGRVSEGLDFPGRTLEALALVGVPYPRPTARLRALQRYFDARFGAGWAYAVDAPTTRRVMQSIGRLVRDATDRGIVFLLDDRYRRLGAFLPRMESLGSDETIEDVLRAWVVERDLFAARPRNAEPA